jgi:hypothetical protein
MPILPNQAGNAIAEYDIAEVSGRNNRHRSELQNQMEFCVAKAAIRGLDPESNSSK